MSIYNLLKYSSNNSDKTGSLWFYSKDESTTFNVDIAHNNNFEYFDYKAKLLASTVAQLIPNQTNGILKCVTIAVPLKYLSNFWRSLELPLINYKLEQKPKVGLLPSKKKCFLFHLKSSICSQDI